jgi:hypothetical protein
LELQQELRFVQAAAAPKTADRTCQKVHSMVSALAVDARSRCRVWANPAFPHEGPKNFCLGSFGVSGLEQARSSVDRATPFSSDIRSKVESIRNQRFFTNYIKINPLLGLSNPRTVTRNRTELGNGLYLFGSSLVSSQGIDVASGVVSAATRATQGLQSSPKLLCFARNRFRQAGNKVAKRTSLILANLADQPFIGSDKPAIVLDRQGQIKAILRRRVSLD